MKTDYTGSGDARRSLELLWGVRRPQTRGPKRGLSVDRIVDVAIALADREGTEALSMRRVAEELGVGAMSLYTYVPGKAELLDLMVDTAFSEQVEALERLAPETGWRAGLDARARTDWDMCLRHGWLVQLASSRSVLGPNETTVLDRTLRLLNDTGLTAREMVAAVDALAMYVTGAARRAVEIREAPRRTGKTDDEWWLERAPLMDEFYDWERFPTVTAVGAAGGFDEPPGTLSYLMQFTIDDFEFGLQRLLDGIEGLIAKRRDQADRDQPGGRSSRSAAT